MDITNDFVAILRFPPYSTLFIIIVTIFVSVFSAVVTKRLTSNEKFIRYSREVKEFKLLQEKALKIKDRKLLRFVDKNKFKFTKMQNELLLLRMKPQLVLYIPMIIVFFLMSGFFSGSDVIVAILPFNLFDMFMQSEIPAFLITHTQLFVPNFWSWYFMVNFVIRGFINQIISFQA